MRCDPNIPVRMADGGAVDPQLASDLLAGRGTGEWTPPGAMTVDPSAAEAVPTPGAGSAPVVPDFLGPVWAAQFEAANGRPPAQSDFLPVTARGPQHEGLPLPASGTPSAPSALELGPSHATIAPGPLSPGNLQNPFGAVGAQGFGGPGFGGVLGTLRSAQQLEEKGLRAQAAAQAQAARESAAALEQEQAVRKEHAETTKANVAALNKENAEIVQDIMNTHIDPKRVWSSKSVGEKAMASIGIILGGMGAGLTGGPNAALQLIQRQIDNDIDAQKADLGKKQNVLANNLAKYGNLFAAEQMTRLQIHAVYEGQLKLAAARSGSAEAMGKADQLIAQSRKQLVGPMMQMAQLQASYSMIQGAGSMPQGYLPSRASPPAGDDPTNPLAFVVKARRDASERTLVGPGGRPFLAYDKEVAGKARPMLQAAGNVEGILREMDKLRRSASGMPGTDAANLYHKYRSALAEQWAMTNGLTQPSEAMNKNLEEVMPTSWDAFARGAVTFQPIRRLLHERVTGIYESAGLAPEALPVYQVPVR